MMRISFEDLEPRSNKSYTLLELMAVVLSRQLKDGDTIGTGAGSAIARAACRLAQLAHAPNLSFVLEGSGAVNPYLEPLAASSGDYSNLDCEAVFAVADFIGAAVRKKIDLFLYNGFQVDQFGNVNNSLLGNGTAQPRLRSPGSGALPVFGSIKKGIILMADHNLTSFVSKVDFRTAPGFLEGGEGWRKAKSNGFTTGEGPVLVISNLGIFDFEEHSKLMRLVSIHPNVTLDQIKAATGFELLLSASVTTTDPPSSSELRQLREIDENRLLKS